MVNHAVGGGRRRLQLDNQADDSELDEMTFQVLGEQCDISSDEGVDESGDDLADESGEGVDESGDDLADESGEDLADENGNGYRNVDEEDAEDECGYESYDYDSGDDYDEELDVGEDLNEEVFMGNDDDLKEDNDVDAENQAENDVDGEENDSLVGEGVGNAVGQGSGLKGNISGVYTTPTRRREGPALASPVVGMSFPSWEGMNNYYRLYGEQQGFGVVCVGGRSCPKLKQENGKSNSLKTYVWRCECYGRTTYRRMVNGKKVSMALDPLVKKKSKKCNCPAMLYGAREQDNSWVVKSVLNEHVNHNPTPTKSNHISMYRVKKITDTILNQIVNDHDSGAPITQIFNNLAGRRNGVENIGFTKKDMHNILNKRMRLRLRDGDAAAMINYLDRMTKDNQKIFHLHRVDKSGKLRDVMWVDARSREAYKYFGDVVCFDSTYLTNKYELPFSNFVGVNHHGQTILLGCALLSHEDAETFVWLFRSWLSCMGGKAPAAMMTDQDAAMRKAIRIAMPMPQTRHRWCMWHIMQKFSRKLGSLNDFPQIKVALQNAIYNSLTPVEFEEEWAVAIKTFKLDTKEETKKCYKWLEGMQTTQRVESINSFFDGYLKKNTRLYQFAPRYCKAMESRANDERAADVNCSRFSRPLVGEFAVERKFQKIHTDAKFVEVQLQCMRVCYVSPISSKPISDVEVEHLLSDKVWVWSKFLKKEISLSGRKRTYVVLFNKETSVAKCDCKHFECHGIVCRHIIKVLDVENVETVPAAYIVDRWRKDIQRKHTLVKVAYHDPEKTEEVKRYDKIMNAIEPVALRGSLAE
ncbi:protein FAR1-RELATED SEQUENCE 6-like [Spinacia oleracea]|uniref:Protein FAR1-RELATED SEQUENCE 6-like n=1 Tax=Spinacia oleracea TaxID=3562 RepID=A0ABM3R3F4_SPIOL|nr:protein FAR1-RELATED SEQUENCE 6-like [Spinacia oleracea]